MKNGFAIRGVATVLVLFLVPTLALAYIDPGNGIYMVQVLMTVFAAAIFYLRHPVRALKALGRWLSASFRRRTSVTAITPEAPVPSGDAHRSSNSPEEV